MALRVRGGGDLAEPVACARALPLEKPAATGGSSRPSFAASLASARIAGSVWFIVEVARPEASRRAR